MPTKRLVLNISPANALLFAVGLTDLLTTIYWVSTGQAVEVNPIMAALLRSGLGVFVMVKLATLLAYVGVMEWYRRRRNPAFARVMGNVALFGYLGIYTISFCCVNFLC